MDEHEAYDLLLKHINSVRDVSKDDFKTFFVFEEMYMFPINSEIFFSVNSNTGKIIRFFRKGLIDYQKIYGRDVKEYTKKLNRAYLNRKTIK